MWSSRKLFQIKSVRSCYNYCSITKLISNANDDSFKTKVSSTYSNWKDDKKLLTPLLHLYKYYNATGINVLQKMILSFNHWLNVPEGHLHSVDDILQLIRNGYTLLDDVEDDSTVRRFLPAAHMIYGIPLSINAGISAFMLAYEKSLAIKDPEAIRMAITATLEMERGKRTHFYWTQYGCCPTEEDVLKNYEKEISVFVDLGVKLLQLSSNNKADFSKLCQYLGIYYSLRNDYMDLWSFEYKEIKKSDVSEDISLGKFSLPIVHAIHNSKYADDILLILKKRTSDTALNQFCLNLIEECGTKQYTIDKLTEIHGNIHEEIQKHGGNSLLENVIDKKLQLRG